VGHPHQYTRARATNIKYQHNYILCVNGCEGFETDVGRGRGGARLGVGDVCGGGLAEAAPAEGLVVHAAEALLLGGGRVLPPRGCRHQDGGGGGGRGGGLWLCPRVAERHLGGGDRGGWGRGHPGGALGGSACWRHAEALKLGSKPVLTPEPRTSLKTGDAAGARVESLSHTQGTTTWKRGGCRGNVTRQG